MAREDTDLPFGDAFLPTQINTGDNRDKIAVVLELINEHESNPDTFDDAIHNTFFPRDEDNTRAKNVRLGQKDRVEEEEEQELETRGNTTLEKYEGKLEEYTDDMDASLTDFE